MNDRLRHRRVARARICIGLVVCAAVVLVAMVWVSIARHLRPPDRTLPT
jgi:hypothetical protein